MHDLINLPIINSQELEIQIILTKLGCKAAVITMILLFL